VIVLADGFGADTITGLDAPVDNGDGTFTPVDTVDVSGLTDANGAIVNTDDVTVTDDGAGNAVLTFPNGESITLIGVSPATADDPAWLQALGIPAPNYIVEGTAGDDLIDANYTGDPQGDMVDANDNQTGTNDDVIYGYGGDDTILAGAGNDLVYGGADNDNVDGGAGDDTLTGDAGDDTLSGGAGNDTLTGGSGTDVFVWTGEGNDVITDFGNDGGGTYTDGDQTNNDFVDLGWLFNDTTLAAYNAANGTSFVYPASAMNHDLADGQIDFNGTDMTGPTLTFDGLTTGLTFDQSNVVCFVRGTRIMTDKGEVPIEDLTEGDLVQTLDHGLQPIRWIGSKVQTSDVLNKMTNLRPIRIAAGALGHQVPSRDLLVSPQHRMLVCSKIAKRMFGEEEVLVAAKHMVSIDGIDVATDLAEVEYFHMLFDQHEIVTANGALSESLFTVSNPRACAHRFHEHVATDSTMMWPPIPRHVATLLR